MATLKLDLFAPDHLKEQAQNSGFFQCPECGLVWFGKPDEAICPAGPRHVRPVHIALLCRSCDIAVPIKELAAHLNERGHPTVQ